MPRRRSSKSSSRSAGTRTSGRKRPSFKLPAFPVRGLIRLGVLACIWGIIGLGIILTYYGMGLPKLIDTAALTRKPSITILAEDGSVVARYGETTGAMVTVDQLPPHVPQAVLAVEDRRFYSHFGVDPIGIARAFYINFRAGRMVQGGSTITQQLAKNLFLSPERSLARKIQEAMLAIWLEYKFTKDEILTAYLNRVYLGAGAYGVDAAARVYFNKQATEINLKEAAMIAGLLRAPSRYSPAANPNLAEARAQVVLNTMVDAGFITEQQLRAMRSGVPTPRRRPGGNDYGRYFADWIINQVEDYVGTDHGDITVQTTLRPNFQRAAEASLQTSVAEGRDRNVGNGAAIIMSTDGAVRALVGGADYDSSQYNRAVQALRQPGSSFKPVIYLSALETAGYTPDTLVEDAPLQIANYAPDNYTGEFAGWIPLREALAKSLNTVAVRILQDIGVREAQNTARRLGLPTPADAGLSYALGTSEVSLLQITSAYASFANGGYAVRPYAIHMIRAQDGALLWRRTASTPDQVVAAQPLAMLVDMMKGVTQFGTGTAAALPDHVVAGKTGTSQDFRDAWFMGFTSQYVGGVWMGNDDNKPMRRITGGNLPARAWKSMMTTAMAGLENKPFPTDGVYYQSSADRRGSDNPLAEAGLIPSDGEDVGYGQGRIGGAALNTGGNRAPAQAGNGGFFSVLRDLTGDDSVEYTYPSDNRAGQNR